MQFFRSLTRSFLLGFRVAAALGSVSAAHGDTIDIAIPNFSFENPSFTSDQVYSSGGGGITVLTAGSNPSGIQDWTFSQENDSNYGIINYSSNGNYTGGTGSQGAYIASNYGYFEVALTSGNATNNDGTTAGTNGIVTTISSNSISYTLSVDVASPASAAIPPPANGWTGFFTLALIDASTGNTLASKDISYLAFGPAMVNEQLSFTPTSADVGDGLKVQLSLVNSPGNNIVTLDNVKLTEEAAPEPGVWAMMLLGAGGLFLLGRRRLMA